MIYVIEDRNQRPYMEDMHSVELKIYKDYDYFAIFDGHGNDKVAIYAKLYLKELIKLEFLNNIPEDMILFQALQKLNTMLPKNIATEAGCTAVVVLRLGTIYWVANVGDSRIIINSNNFAIPISEDHKPNTERERKRIEDLGGQIMNVFGTYRVQGNLALSRALGDFNLSPFVTWVPDIYKVTCNNTNTFLILATDGLWDAVNNQEVVDVIYNKQNRIEEGCKELVALAKKRGSGDNITILYISI
jgi:serine/threonine protein phosphatase PrpC